MTLIITGLHWQGYAASILTIINEDIGPDPRYSWISHVCIAAHTIFMASLGRLTDVFGRRYLFIGGAVLGVVGGVVGSIVCATAKSVPILIAGNILLGIRSATQLSFHLFILYLGEDAGSFTEELC